MFLKGDILHKYIDKYIDLFGFENVKVVVFEK